MSGWLVFEETRETFRHNVVVEPQPDLVSDEETVVHQNQLQTDLSESMGRVGWGGAREQDLKVKHTANI